MAGVKGKSGRKTRGGEVMISELTNMSVKWAMSKWPRMDDSDKMKILLALAPKYVPQEHKHEGEIVFSEKLKSARSRITELTRLSIN